MDFLKNANWNALLPVIVGTAVVGVGLWYAFKPGGFLNKFDGETETEE